MGCPCRRPRPRRPSRAGCRACLHLARQSLVIDIDKDGLPIPPSADLASDPNFQTIWDFIEATWHDYGNRTVLHMNVTQVDAFGLAFKLEHNGFDPADHQAADGHQRVRHGRYATRRDHHVVRSRGPLEGPSRIRELCQRTCPQSAHAAEGNGPGQVPEGSAPGVHCAGSSVLHVGSQAGLLIRRCRLYRHDKANGDFAFVPNKATDDGGNATSSYLIKVPEHASVLRAQDIISQPNDGPGAPRISRPWGRPSLGDREP